ncbi:hypothetical protein QP141_06240 [Alloscardovia omnicolens]|nr:hypothetical protein [Alloscardovia omnicolens]MDK6250026.1 hypothetical protein [Alloscardovia omnicolens]
MLDRILSESAKQGNAYENRAYGQTDAPDGVDEAVNKVANAGERNNFVHRGREGGEAAEEAAGGQNVHVQVVGAQIDNAGGEEEAGQRVNE